MAVPIVPLDKLSIEEQRALLVQLLQQQAAPPTLTSVPISFAQERLWFLEQLTPGTATYHLPIALRLSGTLDVGALEHSFAQLMQRHESLRTTFGMIDGRLMQLIAPNGSVPLTRYDLRARLPEEREPVARQILETESARPFDLASGPLLRACLIRLESPVHVLLVTLHHIIADGWSLGVFVREMAAFYQAASLHTAPQLPPMTIHYADFAAWQREWLQGELLTGQLTYWKEQLHGALPILQLPTNQPRPPIQNFHGHTHTFTLQRDLVDRLRALGHDANATLFMTLLAAFQVLLARHSGQTDIIVGTPIAGRTRAETEGLIGFFVNTLVIRTDLGGDLSFRDLLQRVRAVCLAAYAHQDVPFEKLVEELQPSRDLSYSPIFQVLFALQNTPVPTIELGELQLETFPIDSHIAKYDLELSLTETATSLHGSFVYNTDLFDSSTIARMARHFEILLQSITADPQQSIHTLPLLTEAEAQHLRSWNTTHTVLPFEGHVHELFAVQAARSPTAIALQYLEQTTTYRALEEQANRLAHLLRERGLRPGQRVGACIEPQIDLIAALLAIFKAGAVYVPIDPHQPDERLRFVLHDAALEMLLTETDLSPRLPFASGNVLHLDTLKPELADQPSTPVDYHTQSSDLAYMIYTSGTTGQPKAVMIEHGSLRNVLLASLEIFDFQPGDRMPLLAAFAFDISLFEILNPLLAGATLQIIPRDQVIDSAVLARHLTMATVVHMVPSLLRQIINVIQELHDVSEYADLRLIFTGGDAVPPELLADVRRRLPHARLEVLYGPTEGTIICTHHTIGDSEVPHGSIIGTPLPNVLLRIYDSHGNLAPEGVPGEIYLGGAGVARGYFRRPDLTAERFVPNPFARERLEIGDWRLSASTISNLQSPISSRLYRTGDLGRFRSEGTLEFLGRTDQQVKVRGFRIELGEIEAVLAEHPSVQAVVVVDREHQPGEKQLVAYIVPKIEDRGLKIEDSNLAAKEKLSSILYPLSSELRTFLKTRLPDYMIPAAWVLLDTLPLTQYGKVDRRALPAPDPASFGTDAEPRAPRSPTEYILAALWMEVLGLPRVGIDADFFALGGHSLLATQLISRICQAFKKEIPLRQLFEYPTVAALADQLDRAQRGTAQIADIPIIPADRRQRLPASFAQQRLWFLHQLQPAHPAYHIPSAVRLVGSLNVAALQTSIDRIVQRHEALRTTFAHTNGVTYQIIHPTMHTPLTFVDIPSLDDRSAAVTGLLERDALQPFDLTGGPLLRTLLVRLAPDEYILQMTMHHIISDAWSMNLLLQELLASYTAIVQDAPAPLEPLSIQYADYAAWQRQWLQGPIYEQQIDYWRRQLSGDWPRLELPPDRPASRQRSTGGASQSLSLPTDVTTALHMLCRRTGVTPFMVFVAVFDLILSRYTGHEDIVVGMPIANRNRIETEGLIGFFVNTLVLRIDLSGNPSFLTLLEQVREVVLQAYAHQDLPFEKLVEELQPERHLGRTPFFDIMINFVSLPPAATQLADIAIEPVTTVMPASKFALSLYITESGQDVHLQVVYDDALFSDDSMRQLLSQIVALLKQAVTTPEAPLATFVLVTPEARAMLPDPTLVLAEPVMEPLPALIRAWAHTHPHLPAISQSAQTKTYAELVAQAEQLARHLRCQGLQTGDTVAVGGIVSFGFISSLVGVLVAGGRLFTIDSQLPRQRQEFMLATASTRFLISVGTDETQWLREQGPWRWLEVDRDTAAIQGQEVDNAAVLPSITPDGQAYLFFTSGSTGQPKGVIGQHKGLSHFLDWQRTTFAVGPGDRVAQLTSLSFDVVLRDIFLPLTSGATLCLPADITVVAADQVLPWLERERITLLHTVPALVQAWLASRTCTPSLQALRRIFFAGEPLTDSLVERWRATFPEAGSIINLYGPTEMTLAKCWYQVPEPAIPGIQPVGQPLPSTQALVLAPNGRLCGVGELGEIVLRSPFRSLGYLNDPDGQRFVPNPFRADPTDIVYHTGDYGRYRADGMLDIVGRMDRQVKIRGLRVELGEIEVALRQHPKVEQAVVDLREDRPGQKRLVAYIVLGDWRLEIGDSDADNLQSPISNLQQELRAFLKQRLPGYMIPSALVSLDALPLLPSGKVDRRALPPPTSEASDEMEIVPPRTATERLIAATWQTVLGIERVGIEQNFFDLGGHSLLVVQIQQMLQTQLGQDIPLLALFQYPTIQALAEYIDQQTQGSLEVQQNTVHKSIERSELRKAAMQRRRSGKQQ